MINKRARENAIFAAREVIPKVQETVLSAAAPETKKGGYVKTFLQAVNVPSIIEKGTNFAAKCVKGDLSGAVPSNVADKAAEAAERAARVAKEEAIQRKIQNIILAGAIVSIVTDITQSRCEIAGHRAIGKTAGAVGNIAYGAIIGYALVGGLEGAMAGAALGWLLWGVVEEAGNVCQQLGM